MKKILLILFFVFIAITLGPFASTPKKGNEHLKFVRVIGEQGDCLFSRISDAAMSSCKDIFIVDSKGTAVSKFTWDGIFVKKIGRPGKGPGDFSWPKSICIHDDRIYVLDMFNSRLMKSDLNLENLDYIRFPSGKMIEDFKVINPNRLMICHYAAKEPTDDKISIIDAKGNLEKSFFNHTPVEVKTGNPADLKRLLFFTDVTYGLDGDTKKVLIAFNTTHNPLVLYLYDLDGKLHKTFKYQMDKKYQFLHILYSGKKTTFNVFKKLHQVNIKGIYFYNRHWYIFITTKHYKRGDYKLTVRNHLKYATRQSFYLKIDESLKLVGKYDVEPYFKCFYISKDGYVLGEHPDSDEEELVIYKIVK